MSNQDMQTDSQEEEEYQDQKQPNTHCSVFLNQPFLKTPLVSDDARPDAKRRKLSEATVALQVDYTRELLKYLETFDWRQTSWEALSDMMFRAGFDEFFMTTNANAPEGLGVTLYLSPESPPIDESNPVIRALQSKLPRLSAEVGPGDFVEEAADPVLIREHGTAVNRKRSMSRVGVCGVRENRHTFTSNSHGRAAAGPHGDVVEVPEMNIRGHIVADVRGAATIFAPHSLQPCRSPRRALPRSVAYNHVLLTKPVNHNITITTTTSPARTGTLKGVAQSNIHGHERILYNQHHPTRPGVSGSRAITSGGSIAGLHDTRGGTIGALVPIWVVEAVHGFRMHRPVPPRRRSRSHSESSFCHSIFVFVAIVVVAVAIFWCAASGNSHAF